MQKTDELESALTILIGGCKASITQKEQPLSMEKPAAKAYTKALVEVLSPNRELT